MLNRLRLTVALVFLVTALRVTTGHWWPVGVTSPALLALAASGAVGFVFGDAWNFRAMVILGAGRASLLAATAPLFTTALAWPILHQEPGPLALVGMLLVFTGVGLALTSQSRRQAGQGDHVEGSERMGVLSGLLGAVGQAGGLVLSKLALRTGVPPLSATVLRVTAGVLILWLMTIAQRQVRRTVGALRDPHATATMTGGAFVGPFLGVTLSLVAIQHIEAGVAASLTALAPLLAMVLAVRFHGERLTWRALAGAAIAITGVVLLFRR